MPPINNSSSSAKASSDAAEERARKLAAMQANASAVERERKQRLEDITAKEEAERQRDDMMRSEKGRFVSGLHRQKENIDLGESLRRQGGVYVESGA